MFSYTVCCSFPNPSLAERWIDWLEREHLQEVLAAGALDAEVIRVETAAGQPDRCEVRYHFASRAAFEVYERDHAPGLRQKGSDKFPAKLGLNYARSTGEVAVQKSSVS
jgi:hypothetical protein